MNVIAVIQKGLNKADNEDRIIVGKTIVVSKILKEILDVLDTEIVIKTKDGKHEQIICDEDDSE